MAASPAHASPERIGSDSLAAIVGPVTYGLVTWATAGNHRLAIVSTASFFVLGLLLLRLVNVERGARQAFHLERTP